MTKTNTKYAEQRNRLFYLHQKGELSTHHLMRGLAMLESERGDAE